MDIIDKIDMLTEEKKKFKVLYPDGTFKYYTSDSQLSNKKVKTAYKVLYLNGKYGYFNKNNEKIDKKEYERIKDK